MAALNSGGEQCGTLPSHVYDPEPKSGDIVVEETQCRFLRTTRQRPWLCLENGSHSFSAPPYTTFILSWIPLALN